MGSDVDTGTGAGTVAFSKISNAGTPVKIDLNSVGAQDDYVPGADSFPRPRFVPAVAADPMSADRFYVVYQDQRMDGSTLTNDVDIRCVKFEKSGSNWTAGSPQRVNTDSESVDSDQFHPMAEVDSSGRIHVVFYDDRLYDQADTEVLPQFDCYYAISSDQGASWTNHRLTDSSSTPTLVKADWGSTGDGGDYIGVALGGDLVWTVLTGSKDDADGGTHNSVIFGNWIDP